MINTCISNTQKAKKIVPSIVQRCSYLKSTKLKTVMLLHTETKTMVSVTKTAINDTN